MEPTHRYQSASVQAEAGIRMMAQSAAIRNFAGMWQNVLTAGEKLVLVGGVVGILSFLAPWVKLTFFFTTASASGFALAQQWAPALFLFPLMMAAALALCVLNASKRPRPRLLAARWYVAIGAAWTCPLLGAATLATLSAGGFAAIAASICILTGGLLQIGEQPAEA